MKTKKISSGEVEGSLVGYTPGPWAVETPREREDPLTGEGDPDWGESYPRGVTVCADWNPPRDGSMGYEICKMSGVHHRTLGDARLIAAAPAMHEALSKIAAWDDEGANRKLESTGDYTSFDEPGSVEIARAALKAVSTGSEK